MISLYNIHINLFSCITLHVNMLFYIVGVSLAVFGLCASQNYTYVDEVNLSQYTGTWYQVYSDLVDRTFEGFGSCITATWSTR